MEEKTKLSKNIFEKHCPRCKTPLNSKPQINTASLYCHLDGTPVGKEMDFLASMFDYCPECGFVSWNDTADCGQEMGFYKFVSNKDRQTILKEENNDVGRRLLLATCRYARSSAVWLYLFRYYWMVGDKDGAKQVGERFVKTQTNLLKGLHRGRLDRSDISYIILIADVYRKLGKFAKALKILDEIDLSRPKYDRIWMSSVDAAVLRKEIALCEGEDDRTDF